VLDDETLAGGKVPIIAGAGGPTRMDSS